MLPVGSSSSADVFYLDVYSPTGCFGTCSPKFRLTNVYSRSLPGSTKSVDPPDALPGADFPCLVVGDFNRHKHAVDPVRVITRSEEKASTPYFDRASDLAYSLLNTPGVYTRFPLSGTFRPSAIDLAFANPLLRRAFLSWDASVLLSTGSDYVPIRISLAAPSNELAPPGPCGTRPTGKAWKNPSMPSTSRRPRSPLPRTSLILGSLTPSTPSQRQFASTPQPRAPPLNQNPGRAPPSPHYARNTQRLAERLRSTARRTS